MLLWFGDGCFRNRMLQEHERYSGCVMDALVTVCSRNTNVTMVWAWMFSYSYAPGTRTRVWLGDGCQKGHPWRQAAQPQNTANMGVKRRPAAWEVHETPRLSAKFSSYDPFKIARLNQAGGKNKLCHSCGVTATLATKTTKSYTAFCENKKWSRWPGLVRSGGPGGLVPVAPSRWPVPVARSRGPVPVAWSRWPGPGGPVPL